MDDLTPVTRTERLLDGEDLTPTNREEMFIKRIYDKTQAIPEPVNRKEYFLKKAGEAGGDITVVPLSVSENGIYSEEGKAYSPVTVEVSPPEDSYQLKSMTTPTSLATFEASAMPMPSLKVSVEAKQASGTPSPSNPLPISGWDEANVVNMSNATNERYFKGLLDGTYGFKVFDGSNDETIDKLPGEYNRFTLKISNNSITWTNAYAKTNKLLCNEFDETTNNDTYFGGTGIHFRSNGAHEVVVAFSSNPPSTVEDFRTWLANNVLYFIYELETPTTPTITPSQFKDLLTAFGLDGYYVPISLPQTVYGGELDVVNGILTITDGYIASYNGETLPSTWISSMDVYAEDTTPTTGAEVCYELANPIIINLTPSLIKSLNGTNNLSVDCGEILEGEYFKALGGE